MCKFGDNCEKFKQGICSFAHSLDELVIVKKKKYKQPTSPNNILSSILDQEIKKQQKTKQKFINFCNCDDNINDQKIKYKKTQDNNLSNNKFTKLCLFRDKNCVKHKQGKCSFCTFF